MEATRKILDLIEQHKSEDAYLLPMRLKGLSPEERLLVSQGVLSKQKIRHKLPQWYANKDIYIPDPTIAEQASSHITAEEKCKWLHSYDLIVDLTGGLGADTFSLSSKSEELIYVEPSPERAEAFRHNACVLGKKVDIYNTTAEVFIRETLPNLGAEQKSILFYADPDRRPDGGDKREQDPRNCLPDILEIEAYLRTHYPSAHLLIKLSPIVDISLLNTLFDFIPNIYALALDGELKEVCLFFDRSRTGSSLITAIHLHHDTSDTVTKPNEKNSEPSLLETLEAFRYIYITNPALSKIGIGGTVWAD
ncbi:MAG: hypothetical protein Q3998_01200 [Porphyromonas sp.]|nr:hypothetical protein [Porphyromonas sp.]